MYEIAELRCKNCGGALNAEAAEEGVIECKYCHSLFAVNRKETLPEAVAQLRIAENELDNNAFDRALTAYKRAIEIDANEPQAYFGMALARHKVQYLRAVKDEHKDENNDENNDENKDENGEKISYLQPICHEYEGKRFTEDESYKKAIELSSGRQREYYESKGEEIEYIVGEFERLSSSGLDYDCFICVKVTDDRTGFRTKDYKDADDIYYYLKRKGYKPFFSETEISDKSGADYEAHILYALYRAECMVVVCHDERYLETPWVKNEYTRFINLIRSERKESDAVTIAFSGKAIERLPGRNGKLQGIDLRRGDSLEKIREFAEKHTPEARARRAEEEERKARESERVKRETEELKRRLEEQQREFEERNRRLQEQLEELAKAKASEQAKTVDVSGLSGEEMLAMMERAQKEREEKARREREKKEAEEERKKREEEERLRSEREKREAEERARREEERRLREAREAKEKEKIEAEEAANLIKLEENAQRLFNEGIFSSMKFNEGNGTHVIIPEGITVIPKDVFYDKKHFRMENNIESIKLPESLRKIDSDAFAHLKAINSISIPKNVEYIGIGAFTGCDYLEEITLPFLGNFKEESDNCESGFLRELFERTSLVSYKYEHDKNKRGGSYIFPPFLKSITITGGNIVKDAFCENAEYSEYSFKKLMFDGVNKVCNFGCRNGNSLEELFLNVHEIGYEAFTGCKRLKNVTITDTVEFIGQFAFMDCSSLEKLIIPNSVKYIGEGAFYGCSRLTEVFLPITLKPYVKEACRAKKINRNLNIDERKHIKFIFT